MINVSYSFVWIDQSSKKRKMRKCFWYFIIFFELRWKIFYNFDKIYWFCYRFSLNSSYFSPINVIYLLELTWFCLYQNTNTGGSGLYDMMQVRLITLPWSTCKSGDPWIRTWGTENRQWIHQYDYHYKCINELFIKLYAIIKKFF